MALTQTQVSKLYVSIFNRASEGSGNTYWQSGADLATVATQMLATSDAATYFGSSLNTNQAFVEHIYLNTLNKTVAQDAAGIAYWVAKLDAGTSRGQVVADLVTAVGDYATSTDPVTLAAYNQFHNRVVVSNYMADTVSAAPSDYATSTSFSSGLTVTSDAATVTTAQTTISNLLPVTRTLTTAVDTITTNKGNDTITADILTLGATDSVVDSSSTDNDTMNITTNANIAATTTITKVENLNVTSLGATTVDMTKITGVNSFTTTGSTGAITITNASNAGMDLGFAGATTNNINATFTADSLAGTADKLTVNLNTATGATATVNAGFESAEINVTGTSTLTSVTAPGVTAVTIAGTGALTVAANGLVGMTDVTITDTAAVKLGAIATTALKTLTATANTGGITGSTAVTATAPYSTDNIAGDTTGLTVLTGAGNDNLKITEAAAAGKSNTIKLGAGDDRLDFVNNATVGASYIFGEAGDDTIRINTAAFAATDYIDGGAGTDTLNVNITGSTLVLNSVENLVLEGLNTTIINSASNALVVDAQITAATDDVSITGLSAGSTFKTSLDVATTVVKANAIEVGFAAVEAATTLNIATGQTDAAGEGDLTVSNVTALTVNYGTATTIDDITVDADATSLTINATGAFVMDDLVSTTEKLQTLTVTGTASVTVDDLDTADAALTSVSISGTVVDLGEVSAATNLTSLTLAASTGAVSVGNIGDGTAVTSLNTVTITGATTATVGTVGATDIGTLSVTATNGALSVGAITAADDVDTISLTSTASTLSFGDITAADDAGITVNLTAKGAISGDGTPLITNAGDITSTLAGAGSAASLAYTATGNAGSVTLNASGLTGGLTTVITNDELTGVTSASSITLGAALASTTNSVTLAGYTKQVTVTGSIGADTVIDTGNGLDGAAANTVNSSDIFAGSTGTDTLSYAGHVATDTNTLAANEDNTNGLAMNFSSSTITFYAGTNLTTEVAAAGTSTLASGHVAQYDSGATGASAAEMAILTGGENDTVSGFETVIATAKNDFIAVSATGMTVTGGAGNDMIVAGAGVDTIVIAASSSTAYSATSDVNNAYAATETITFGNGVDVITGFTAGASGDKLSTGVTGGVVATSGLAATLADNTNATADTAYFLSGSFNTTTGVFTIAANGAGADTVIWSNVNAANDTKATVNTWVVLIGVDSDNFHADNFIA